MSLAEQNLLRSDKMALFGKKAQPEDNVPVREVVALRQRGLPNEDIVKYLKKRGYSIAQIRDAITQVDIKTRAVGGTQEAPAPPPLPGMPPTMPATVPIEPPELGPGPDVGVAPEFTPPIPEIGPPPIREEAPPEPTMFGNEEQVERVERILEQIIEEKWREASDRFRKFSSWQSKTEERVNLLDDRMKELSTRMDNLNKMLMGKIEEYSETMEDVGTEIKALEKVMSNIVPSLSESVKELRGLTAKKK